MPNWLMNTTMQLVRFVRKLLSMLFRPRDRGQHQIQGSTSQEVITKLRRHHPDAPEVWLELVARNLHPEPSRETDPASVGKEQREAEPPPSAPFRPAPTRPAASTPMIGQKATSLLGRWQENEAAGSVQTRFASMGVDAEALSVAALRWRITEAQAHRAAKGTHPKQDVPVGDRSTKILPRYRQRDITELPQVVKFASGSGQHPAPPSFKDLPLHQPSDINDDSVALDEPTRNCVGRTWDELQMAGDQTVADLPLGAIGDRMSANLELWADGPRGDLWPVLQPCAVLVPSQPDLLAERIRRLAQIQGRL